MSSIIVPKFNLVLCELYNSKIHGNKMYDGHYLCSYTIPINDENDENDDDSEDDDDEYYEEDDTKIIGNIIQTGYDELSERLKSHTLIRNYKNIVSNPNYITPQIAQIIITKSGEHLVIIKTYWIKIIQRRWKKIYRRRYHFIFGNQMVKQLKYREIHGRWHYPLPDSVNIKSRFLGGVLEDEED